MQWVSDVASVASDAMSGVGSFLEENQWASDALAGGAAAGLNYLSQKDEQKFLRRQEDRAWDRKMHLAKAPDIDKEKYNWTDMASGSVTNGGLTNGGLISGAQKR